MHFSTVLWCFIIIITFVSDGSKMYFQSSANLLAQEPGHKKQEKRLPMILAANL